MILAKSPWWVVKVSLDSHRRLTQAHVLICWQREIVPVCWQTISWRLVSKCFVSIRSSAFHRLGLFLFVYMEPCSHKELNWVSLLRSRCRWSWRSWWVSGLSSWPVFTWCWFHNDVVRCFQFLHSMTRVEQIHYRICLQYQGFDASLLPTGIDRVFLHLNYSFAIVRYYHQSGL